MTRAEERKVEIQRLFDMAVRGLASQDWQLSTATDKYGREISRYRSENRKCAIGHLISTEVYGPAIENRSVSDFDVRWMISVSTGIATSNVETVMFLEAMQVAHDSCILNVYPDGETREKTQRKASTRLRCNFRAIADKFQLSWPTEVNA